MWKVGQRRRTGHRTAWQRQATVAMAVLAVVCVAAVNAQAGELEYQTQTTADDTYAVSPTEQYRSYTYCYSVPSGTTYSYARWPIRVPKGATVTSAALLLNSAYTSSTAGTGRIRLIDLDDCPTFSTNPYNLAVSTSYVDWPITEWTLNQWYESSDISSLVQAFVDREGYEYDSNLGLRLEYGAGAGGKKASTWDRGPLLGPKLQITYTGGEAIVTLHMADPHIRIAQKVYCVLENVNATDSMEAVLDQTQVFAKSGPLNGEEVFVTDYSQLAAGQHTLVVRIRDSQQNIRGEASRTWTTLHNGIPTVGINENNAICVSGEPFFPVTSWLYGEDYFSNGISQTINTLLGEGWYPTHNLASWEDYLEVGENQGWWVGGPTRWDGFVGSDPNNSDTTKLAAYVNATKTGYPSLLMWNWDDEPELGAPEQKNYAVRDWTELCHSLDTNHPTYVNFTGYVFTNLPTGPETVKKFCYLYNKDTYGENCLVADILSIDYYCYEYASKWTWCTLADAMQALDNVYAWNRNLAPVMSFIESQDLYYAGHPELQWPWTPGLTPTQLHNLIWLTVIHNAKGISWYHYHCATPAANIAVMSQFLEDITVLTPVVLGPEETDYEVTTSLAYGGRVDHMERQYGDDLWIFAGEVLSSTGETVTFNVSFLEDGDTVVVYGEDRTIEAEDGYFVDDFDSLAIHIYVLSTNPPAEPVDVEYQIAASGDDMYCSSWSTNYTGQTIFWPYNSTDLQRAFMRWQLDIPAGATINSAHLEVKSYVADYSTPTTVRLRSINSDDCPAFTPSPWYWGVSGNYVDWALGTWSMNTWYESPSLVELLQDFVDRPGYEAGSYFGLRASYASGTYRYIWSFDHAAADGAVLVVNYTP